MWPAKGVAPSSSTTHCEPPQLTSRPFFGACVSSGPSMGPRAVLAGPGGVVQLHHREALSASPRPRYYTLVSPRERHSVIDLLGAGSPAAATSPRGGSPAPSEGSEAGSPVVDATPDRDGDRAASEGAEARDDEGPALPLTGLVRLQPSASALCRIYEATPSPSCRKPQKDTRAAPSKA